MPAFDRRSFLAAGAALAIGAIGALTGCSTTSEAGDAGAVPRNVPSGSEPAARPPIRSVVVLGDSISRATVDDYTTAFNAAAIPDVVVDAETGRRIEVGNGKGDSPLSGVRSLFALLADGADPDAWVIELGTNDIGSYATPEEYGRLIDQILGMLDDQVPLVWVNTYRPQYPELTDVFNLVLSERIGKRPNAVVADWFSVASAPDQQVLRSDDLHPNADGSAVLAMLVLQALQTF